MASERSNGHNQEIITAPAGMYARLQSIESGTLGNAFRKITVSHINGSPNLDVYVRFTIGRRLKVQTVYTLEITPNDVVEKLSAKRVWLYPRSAQSLPTPDFNDVLGQIQNVILIHSKDKVPIG